MPDKLRVTLVKSPVSHTARIRATVRALGLHKIGDAVEIDDTPSMRGMANAVRFLLRTEEPEQAQPAPAPVARRARPRKPKEEANT